MEIQKALDELKALKIDYNLDLGIDFEKAQAEINQALQLQQTGVMDRFNISEDELIKGFQNSISLLKQTTEFEVLDSFKIKVDELEKLLEETKM